MDKQDYTYEDSGFDGFLTRPFNQVGQTAQTSQPSTQSRELNFDQSAVSGALGDTFRVGLITINGKDGNIIVSDGEKDRVIIGVIPD